jgi:hypothetical protein
MATIPWTHNLLRFLKHILMDPIDEPRILFSPRGVVYPLAAFCNGLKDDRAIHSCTVNRIIHYKETNSIGHEFLVFDIVINRRGTVETTSRYIRLERGPEPGSKSSKSNPAMDQVKFSGSTELKDALPVTDCEIVQTISMSRQHPVPLLRLLGFIYYIPQIEPDYDLRSKQCYWFCWVIVHFVEKNIKGIHCQPGPAKEKARRAFAMEWARGAGESYEEILLAWGKQTSENQEIITNLERTVLEERSGTEARLMAEIRAEAERRERAEAEMRVEAQRRERAEQDKRIAEEGRRAAEEERRVAEEERRATKEENRLLRAKLGAYEVGLVLPPFQLVSFFALHLSPAKGTLYSSHAVLSRGT